MTGGFYSKFFIIHIIFGNTICTNNIQEQFLSLCYHENVNSAHLSDNTLMTFMYFSQGIHISVKWFGYIFSSGLGAMIERISFPKPDNKLLHDPISILMEAVSTSRRDYNMTCIRRAIYVPRSKFGSDEIQFNSLDQNWH